MTEKEEKAIKNLKEIIDLSKEEIENNDENTTVILDITDLKSLAIVLETLEQKDKEIQELKEKWNKDIHTLQNQLDVANADRVEKDKIIDLMARFIDTELSSDHLSKVLKIEVKPLETYREDIKQYFKKKVGNKNYL